MDVPGQPVFRHGMLVIDRRGCPAVIHRVGNAIAQLAYPTGELEIVFMNEIEVAPPNVTDGFRHTPVLLAILRSSHGREIQGPPSALDAYHSTDQSDSDATSWTEVQFHTSNVTYFHHRVVDSVKQALSSDRMLCYTDVVHLVSKPRLADDFRWLPSVMPRHWHSVLVQDGPPAALKAILEGIAYCEPISLSPLSTTAEMLRRSMFHVTQFEQALSAIRAALATTLCVDGHCVTTQHINMLMGALNHINTPDFSDEDSWRCYSTPLMSTISSVQLNYLRGFYDCTKHDFLHSYLALLGTMQNLVFLTLSQVKQVLTWIQELFIPRNSSTDDSSTIVANIEVREAAMRSSHGKMGPRSSSMAWPRPLTAVTSKRPLDLTLEDSFSSRVQDFMDPDGYHDISGLASHHVNKKCKMEETGDPA
jgi:hypothetical protein